MLLDLIKHGSSIKVKPFGSSYMRLVPVQSSSKGVLKQQFVFEEFDFGAESEKFSSSDFSLDNIIATGSTNMLNPVVMFRMSDMTLADKFENFSFESSKTE